MLLMDGYIVFLGFHSGDNYSAKDRKKYGSFLGIIDSTVFALWFRFLQNLKEGWHGLPIDQFEPLWLPVKPRKG